MLRSWTFQRISFNNTTNLDMTTSSIFSSGVYILFIVILITVVVVALFANFILISIILWIPKLRSVTHIFLLNLVITDILMALLVIPIEISKLMNNSYFIHGIEICELSNTVFFLSLPASAWSLFLLTFERYVTLKFPFSYRRLFTKVKTAAILIFVWAYFIIIASLPVLGWRPFPSIIYNGNCMFFFTIPYAIMMVSINFSVPIVITLALNIGIFLIAEQAARHGKKKKGANGRRLSLSYITYNTKAAKKILLLVGVFTVCWLPYIVVVSLNIRCRGCITPSTVWICLILNYSSCALNPVLYGWMNPSIRKELKKASSKLLFKCTYGYLDLNHDGNNSILSGRNTSMTVSSKNGNSIVSMSSSNNRDSIFLRETKI